jgi:hypothetical protein
MNYIVWGPKGMQYLLGGKITIYSRGVVHGIAPSFFSIHLRSLAAPYSTTPHG